MNWLKVNLSTYQKVQNINPDKGTLLYNLSPRPFTPTGEEENDFNAEVLSVKVSKALNTYELIQLLLDQQSLYDKSEEVNCFILGDNKYWLDKDTRVGLINSLNIQKDAGVQDTLLWLNGNPYRVSIDYALAFLRNLELYAVECYNVTQAHYAEIKALPTREALFDYNVSAGYPTPIVFDIEELVK